MIPLSALTVLLLASCATTNSTKTLTAFDDNKQVRIAVGQVFAVELRSNPTTGYRWNYRQPGDAVVEKVGEPAYLIGSAPVGAVGGGGTEIWRFRATKTGQQALQLEYARPFEKDVPPAQTVVFNLVVSNGQ